MAARTISDIQQKASSLGYLHTNSGYYKLSDGSGPYSFDGVNFLNSGEFAQVPTYTACAFGITPALTKGFFTLVGSDTAIVRVHLIAVNGASGSSSRLMIAGTKRISPNSGGVSVAMPAVSNDTQDSDATAVAKYWATIPTALGTLKGYLFAGPLVTIGSTPASATPAISEVAFPPTPLKPLILRSASESFGLTTDNTFPSDIALNITVVWSETPIQ